LKIEPKRGIGTLIGAGAMGAVYLAEDSLLRRNVALKTPTFKDDTDGELLRRFHREARAVASLKHPNLCAVYDVGVIDGRPYISMEFVQGQKLSDLIKPDKPMAEKQAMSIVRKIAMGMQEAHAHRVIHRDLKPDNIMVNQKGEPVVMDFGLVHNAESKNSTKITQKGTLIGSPVYMSKEQVEGDPDKLTGATDQYSLGVILYQLLTSKLPFEGGIHAVLAAILTKEPTPPSDLRPDLNPHLEAVCLKMMAKQAEDRYPSMKSVADTILEVMRGTSSVAGASVARRTETNRAAGTQEHQRVKSLRGRPWSRSRIAAVSLAVVGIVVLLGAITLLFLSGDALVRLQIHPDDVQVGFKNETAKFAAGAHEYRTEPGVHILHIKCGNAEFDTQQFTLQKGDNPSVIVELTEHELLVSLGTQEIARHRLSSPSPQRSAELSSISVSIPLTPVTPAPLPTLAASWPWQPVESRFPIGHRGRDAKLAISPNGKFIAVDCGVHEAATGTEVWTAAKIDRVLLRYEGPGLGSTGTKVRTTTETLLDDGKDNLVALSPDGGYFVEGEGEYLSKEEKNGQTLKVSVNEKNGNPTNFELPGAKNIFQLKFLQFAGEKWLVASWSGTPSSLVRVYDVKSPARLLKEFPVNGFDAQCGAISGDGKYLAIASGYGEALKIYDLATGLIVVTMAQPPDRDSDFRFTGLAFSPDNEEVAGLIGEDLIVWSIDGRILEEFVEIVERHSFGNQNGLLYLADKSGWLIQNQTFFNRKRRKPMWQLQIESNYVHQASVLDVDHVLISHGSPDHGQISVITIPRQVIANAEAAIDENVECVLAPGKSISITYEIGEPRFGDRQEVANELNAVLVARLKKLGIMVADNQPVSLKVVYTEIAGPKIEIPDFMMAPTPFGRQPSIAGSTMIIPTNMKFVASLTRKDDPRVWWTVSLKRGGSLSNMPGGNDNERILRAVSFSELKRELGEIDLPWFLPVDAKISWLPLRTKFGK
ncbi:MAG TPA: WD40 repeat domain-containing serine/threonine protein kinase, partial [Planctomycetaceae bacterium]|nr:WD40 repeat domain-containing serine/threonine protein kinase [Planctomycetaceae bacterium]